MAGLLDGVLPYLYSQSDRLKRHVGGLLSDPMGTLEQTAGGLLDSHKAQQGLLSQAFANEKRPFQVTDKNAMMQAAQNMLNGPLGMAPTGITAWHGSPHVFDKFDGSKIGTGEGAQAYGHGLYLAERPETAATYKTAGIDANEPMYVHSARMALDDPIWGGTIAEKAKNLRTTAGNQAADYLLKNHQTLANTNGSLYKVDLPDSAVAKMLDWDKPLSQQAPEVQGALQKSGLMQYADQYFKQNNKTAPTAADFHDFLKYSGYAQSEIAPKLAEHGIPGIRYLDGGSRGAGAGSSNFVVFPGEESLLQILERNGQPLR